MQSLKNRYNDFEIFTWCEETPYSLCLWLYVCLSVSECLHLYVGVSISLCALLIRPSVNCMYLCLRPWLSVCFVCLTIFLVCVFLCLRVCLSVFISICLNLHFCVFLYLHICRSVCISICLFVSVYFYLSVCLSICLWSGGSVLMLWLIPLSVTAVPFRFGHYRSREEDANAAAAVGPLLALNADVDCCSWGITEDDADTLSAADKHCHLQWKILRAESVHSLTDNI